MKGNTSGWQTDALTTAFLQGVRGAIPAAALQLEVLSHIIGIWRPHPRRVLDLGCGDGILGRFLLEQDPETHILFADFSDPMLEAARKQLENQPRATFVKADFSSRSWLEAIAGHGSFDAVVSGFAIHHQSDARKKELYGEIFNLLDSGGLFLNLEHVESATPNIKNLFDTYFIDSLYNFHATTDPSTSKEALAQQYYDRPDRDDNILAPVQEQCQWLRDIGFTDVDCFFKVFELALFGGKKPIT
jgi:tRNA (cmo5U34)-methyltransferase